MPSLPPFVERAHQDYGALNAADQRRFGMYLEQGIHTFDNFLKYNDSLPRKLAGLDDAVANYFHDMLATPRWSGVVCGDAGARAFHAGHLRDHRRGPCGRA